MDSQQMDKILHLMQEQNEEEMEVDKAADNLFQPTQIHLFQDLELNFYNTICPPEEPMEVDGMCFTKYALKLTISGEGEELPLLGFMNCNAKSLKNLFRRVQNEEPMEVNRAAENHLFQDLHLTENHPFRDLELQPTENHPFRDLELIFNNTICPVEEPMEVDGMCFTKYVLKLTISGEREELPLPCFMNCNAIYEKSLKNFFMPVQNEEEMKAGKATDNLPPTDNHLFDLELNFYNTAICPLEEPIEVDGIHLTKFVLISGEGVEFLLLYCNEKSPQKFLMHAQNEEPMEVDGATQNHSFPDLQLTENYPFEIYNSQK